MQVKFELAAKRAYWLEASPEALAFEFWSNVRTVPPSCCQTSMQVA